jgi:preprotein translocase subunit SecE
MRLVVGTIICVIIVTVLVGIVGYLLDQGKARLERRD